MPYHACQQERIDRGLCVTCAKPRGIDGTTIRCAVCNRAAIDAAITRRAQIRAAQTPEEKAEIAAKKHAYYTARYAARKQARACVRCGRPVQGANYLNKRIYCAACQKAARDRKAEVRQKQRLAHSPWAGLRQGKPLPMGAAAERCGSIRTYKIGLDTGALQALRELKKRDREVRLKQSKDGTVEIIYQTSRIVREALRSWADLPECPTRSPEYRKMIECPLTFLADARTVAAIERHAPARGGNLSAAVCDLLVATAKRPNFTPKRTLPRLSAGGGVADPWDEE